MEWMTKLGVLSVGCSSCGSVLWGFGGEGLLEGLTGQVGGVCGFHQALKADSGWIQQTGEGKAAGGGGPSTDTQVSASLASLRAVSARVCTGRWCRLGLENDCVFFLLFNEDSGVFSFLSCSRCAEA